MLGASSKRMAVWGERRVGPRIAWAALSRSARFCGTATGGGSERPAPPGASLQPLRVAPDQPLYTTPPKVPGRDPDLIRAAKLRELRAKLSWSIAKLEKKLPNPVVRVEGAGVEQANGGYIRCGEHDGAACYENEHCYLMRYQLPGNVRIWYISLKENLHEDEGDLYYSYGAGTDVPFLGKWQVGKSGKMPPPSFSRATGSQSAPAVAASLPRPTARLRRAAQSWIRAEATQTTLTDAVCLMLLMRGLYLLAICWVVHNLFGYASMFTAWCVPISEPPPPPSAAVAETQTEAVAAE
eukprot:TRINITY_DN6398_c0_g1_i1.p1 TRINITY_DN6398_c0_g1~~TRINITY_DN6398_c0_g1_i1.p1  ORF type:complete len:326 (+),score=41.60 TRINITY_DN6398_c0_g1_i1:93-980(+)